MTSELPIADLGVTGAALPARIGPFSIRGQLGRGGMGVVLDATMDDGRRVALKLIRPAGNAEEQEILMARLLREAAAIARVSHPGIVSLVKYGHAQGAVYLAMEFVMGVTLKDIQRRTSLDAVTLISLGTQILKTLAHLHDNGVIHRDIKPENVLIDTSGRAVLADFGIAWFEEAAGITRPGEVVGSAGYLSPECFEGAPPSAGSDIYALGRTLFEVAAILPPERIDRNLPVLYRFAKRMEVNWDRFPSKSPWPAIQKVIAKMIATDPKHRYQSAADCLDAFVGLSRLVRPGTPGIEGQKRDSVEEEFTRFEPARTLSAFVDHLDLAPRSPWANAADSSTDFDEREVSTVVPDHGDHTIPELVDQFANTNPNQLPDARGPTIPDGGPQDMITTLGDDTIGDPLPPRFDGTSGVVTDVGRDPSGPAPRRLRDEATPSGPVPTPPDAHHAFEEIEETITPPPPRQQRREISDVAPLGAVVPEPEPDALESQRLPRTRRPAPVTRPTVPSPGPNDRATTKVPDRTPTAPAAHARAAPRRLVPTMLGLALGLVAGLSTAWIADRPAAPTPKDAALATSALHAARNALADRDLAAARGWLEKCVAAGDIPECRERLAILLALQGDPRAGDFR